MLDSLVRRWIDPPLRRFAVRLATFADADTYTLIGFAAGAAAAVAAGLGAFKTGLVLFALGRLLDGVDGAVARATAQTDRGGFLDIALDFAIYAMIPFAFACYDPATNALAAAALLAAIVLNGSAFLAYAVMAERRGETTAAQGEKSLFYLAGLAEGTETVVVYALFFLLPQNFAAIAWLFSLVCVISGVARIAVAWRTLR